MLAALPEHASAQDITAILGNTIRLRALHNLFWGGIGIDFFSVLMKPSKFLTLWCIPHDAERI